MDMKEQEVFLSLRNTVPEPSRRFWHFSYKHRSIATTQEKIASMFKKNEKKVAEEDVALFCVPKEIRPTDTNAGCICSYNA